MKENNLIHWKVGGKLHYAGVEILPNMADIEYIVIDHITFHETLDVQGRQQNNVWLAHFVKGNGYTDLPFILNTTNRRRICKQAKTNYLQTVKNFAVRLTSEKARDMSGEGGEVDALRVSKIPAKQPTKEKLTQSHANWQKCVDYVKSGKPVSDLLSKYEISAEVEKELIACMSQGK